MYGEFHDDAQVDVFCFRLGRSITFPLLHSSPRRVSSSGFGLIAHNPTSMTPRGAFIVFEGLDRCGKTTQVEQLAQAMRREGKEVRSMKFPGELLERPWWGYIKVIMRMKPREPFLDDNGETGEEHVCRAT